MIVTARQLWMRPCVAFLLICGFALPVRAQQAPDYKKNEFATWGGYSFDSPQVFGTESDRRFGVLALRYGRTFLDRKLFSLEYTADVFPVEIMRQPSFIACVILTSTGFFSAFCPVGRESVYGGGMSPLGLKANFLRRRRFQPFAAVSVGFIETVRPIPEDVPTGTQFNFTFDFQAGFQHFNATRTRSWMFGYKLEHISNAYISNLDPGVDNNLFFVGYSFFK